MAYSNCFTNMGSLSDEITNIIRERILSGEYDIGEKLKETAIADELKVSRTPVREALKELEDEGLVEYIPYRGCFALGFTKQDIDDIYDVRKALELLTIEWAIDKITDAEIEELRLQCKKMEEYTAKFETEKAIGLNSSFHDIIYRAAGSRFMTQVLHSYKGYIERAKKEVMYNQNYLFEVIREHNEVLNGIKLRDKELAKKAMADHLDGSKRRAALLYFDGKCIK